MFVSTRGDERPARSLAESLEQFGFDVVYLGREIDPHRIAAKVVEEKADAVELCVDERSALLVLRLLLRALAEAGRSDARIILHRMP